MKKKVIYDELTELLKDLGYKVRKENGNFEGGACIIKDEKLIVLNKNTPIELHLSIMSAVAYEYSDKFFIKPKLREFIENEAQKIDLKQIEIVVLPRKEE